MWLITDGRLLIGTALYQKKNIAQRTYFVLIFLQPFAAFQPFAMMPTFLVCLEGTLARAIPVMMPVMNVEG